MKKTYCKVIVTVDTDSGEVDAKGVVPFTYVNISKALYDNYPEEVELLFYPYRLLFVGEYNRNEYDFFIMGRV